MPVIKKGCNLKFLAGEYGGINFLNPGIFLGQDGSKNMLVSKIENHGKVASPNMRTLEI